MTSAKQKAWRAEFARRYGHGGAKRRRSTGGYVAKGKYKRKGGSFGGFSMGRVLSMKNIALTVGGALIAPRLGMSSQLGAAVGGAAGAGLMGAAVGYFAGAPVANAFGGITGASASSNNDLG